MALASNLSQALSRRARRIASSQGSALGCLHPGVGGGGGVCALGTWGVVIGRALLVPVGWVGGMSGFAGWVEYLWILRRSATELLPRLVAVGASFAEEDMMTSWEDSMGCIVSPSGGEGWGRLVGRVFGRVVPGGGSSAALPLQGVRCL